MPIRVNYSVQIEELINSQLKDWTFASKSYSDLDKVITKKLQFDGFYVIVQHNPARIISSSAKTDKLSIEKRPCFLCDENRPIKQKGLDLYEKFKVLLNPYPIFPKHLTIIHKNHVPQLIKPYFNYMLDMAMDLKHFTIFYNGPKFGASAPDHFHFQACLRGCMPLENQMSVIKEKYGVVQKSGDCEVWKADDELRRFFLIESKNKQAIMSIFSEIYECLCSLFNSDEEPGMNIICFYTENSWKVELFPRVKHRPWQYSAHEPDNILFSPASADLGGLLVLSVRKDFDKMGKELTIDLMKQIGISKELFDGIILKH